jgi:hypothetical protein
MAYSTPDSQHTYKPHDLIGTLFRHLGPTIVSTSHDVQLVQDIDSITCTAETRGKNTYKGLVGGDGLEAVL